MSRDNFIEEVIKWLNHPDLTRLNTPFATHYIAYPYGENGFSGIFANSFNEALGYAKRCDNSVIIDIKTMSEVKYG